MIVKTFRSRYTIHIFEEIKNTLKKEDIHITKDPYYLNNAGEGRFMISANTIQEYNTAIQTVSNMIGHYLNKDKKLIHKNNKAPPPLNIIL